jgi:hypothetical protein
MYRVWSFIPFGMFMDFDIFGIGGGDFMYGGFICKFVVICSSFVFRSAMFILVVLWYMHSILMASVSLQGSLLSSGDMVGSMYVMVSGMK